MKLRRINFILAFCAALLCVPPVARGAGDADAPPAVREADTTAPRYAAEGIASWYGRRFHGRKTANGERFNQHALTCAHRTLPFGSWVKVTNVATGEQVTVRVNDRGPFIKHRIIDLSDAAAKAINMKGCSRVRVELLRDLGVEVEAPSIATTRKTPSIDRRVVSRKTEDTAVVVYTVVPDSTVDSITEAMFPITRVKTALRTSDEPALARRTTAYRRCSMGVRIVDTNDIPVDIHGYTVVVAVTNRYAEAVAERDRLLARGYRSVSLVIASTCGESHYKVCVGMEPMPIACTRTADFLSRDYPTITITYVDRIDDDQNTTTALAY